MAASSTTPSTLSTLSTNAPSSSQSPQSSQSQPLASGKFPTSPLSTLSTILGDNSVARATPEYVPMSDEVEQANRAQLVRELFHRARDARRPLIAKWKKNYKVLNNKVWGPRAEPWMPAPEISNVWPLVASSVAWMTDQRPGCEVAVSAPPFNQYADFYDKLAWQMNSLLDASFSVNNLDGEIEKLLWDVSTYGVGYLKSVWKPWLADGKGDSVFDRVDPFTFYPDPNARSMQDANFFIEAKIMSREDLDRAYPGAGGVGSFSGEDIDESPRATANVERRGRLNLTAIKSGVNVFGTTTPSNPDNRFGYSQRGNAPFLREDQPVVVLEAWIRTHYIMDHTDDDTIPEGSARVIDRWKCIVVTGNTVLMDYYADEIYGFPTHPYSRMVMFETGDWYGPSLVEFLTSPQESVNRLLANIEQNIMLIGNPIMIEGPSANIGGRRTITNRPGQRLQGNKESMGWLDPPQIHPEIVQLIGYYESKMESISGLSAIMRGFSSTGRNSSEVMSTLQDSAFVRVRATLRNLERCLRDATSKMSANIAEFYTEPRLISIIGPDGKVTSQSLRARHFYTLPGPDGEQQTPLRFSLRADAGSDHPTSRQARRAQMETLFAMGAVDVIALLEAENIPNWPDIANRVLSMQAANGTLGMPPGARQATRS